MTDTQSSGQLPQAGTPPARKPRRWRGALAGIALIGIGAVGGYVAGAAQDSWWILSAAAHGRFDPERMEKRIDRRVDRMLGRVDATQEQRDKVKGIFKSALTDVKALGVKPGQAHEDYINLLRSDKIDPAAFEALRAQHMQKADAVSKRFVQAFAEAAEVLTPDQRRQLADRMERHGHRHHRDRDEDRTQNQNQAPAPAQTQGQTPDAAPKQ